MFDQFTDGSRKAISVARQEAQRLNSEFVGTEHLLLGLAIVPGKASKIMKRYALDLKMIRAEIEKLVTPSPSPTVTLGQLPFSPRAKVCLELAGKVCLERGSVQIAVEHVLEALLRDGDGLAYQILTNLGAVPEIKGELAGQRSLVSARAGTPLEILHELRARAAGQSAVDRLLWRKLEAFVKRSGGGERSRKLRRKAE